MFTGTGSPLHGHAVAVTGGRITAIVPDAEADELIDERTRVVQLDGALLSPGFQDAHIHPVGAGVELLQCNLTEADGCRRHGRPRPRLRRRQPRRAVDPRRRLVDGPLPGRRPGPRAARRGRARPPGAPAQPRPPQHVGEQRRDPARRASTRRRPIRPTGASSARPTARRPAPSTRERATCSTASGRRSTRISPTPASSARSANCSRSASRAGRTRWSAARSAACPTRSTRTDARSPRTSSSCTWSAPSGGSGAAASSRSTR